MGVILILIFAEALALYGLIGEWCVGAFVSQQCTSLCQLALPLCGARWGQAEETPRPIAALSHITCAQLASF